MKPLNMILIVVGVLVLAIAIALILHFTVFTHSRYQKQVRELDRRFQYLHALVFGQISQYLKRIENVSSTNLLYVNTYMEFTKRFKEVRDKSDSSAQYAINKMKDLLSSHAYKELKAYLPEAKKTMDFYDKQVNSLNSDLYAVIKPEEDCNQQALLLKENLRKVKQDYFVKQADLTMVSASFEKVFAMLEEQFKRFDQLVVSAHYDEAAAMLPKISAVIKELAKDLTVLPNLCVSIQSVIPDRLNTLEDRYQEMVRAEYPLFNLIRKDSVDELRAQLDVLSGKVKNFELNGVQQSLDAILAKIDEYNEGFDAEKDARVKFESDYEKIYLSHSELDKKYVRLCNALPDIKKIYVISDEEKGQLETLASDVNKAGATKRLLETYVHSANRQPYSLLVDKMEDLRAQTEACSNAIDDFQHYLVTLKGDSEEANRDVALYYKTLKEQENLLKQIDIPAVTAKFQPEIDSLFVLLDEIHVKLNQTPIDAADLSEKATALKGDSDKLSREIKEQYDTMRLADAAILYGNRSRSEFSDIASPLSQAEGLYFQGNFKAAYDEAAEADKRLRRE